MKVEDKTAAELVLFTKLYPGEVFRTDGQIYMKTDQIKNGDYCVNAVNLSTGNRCTCNLSLSVEKLNVKLTILPNGTMEEE